MRSRISRPSAERRRWACPDRVVSAYNVAVMALEPLGLGPEGQAEVGEPFDLQIARERAARTLDNVSDGLAILDRQWRFIYVNIAAGQMLGRRPEDLLGTVVWEQFPEAVGTEFWDRQHRAMATQEMDSFEAYYGPLNGWFELRLFPTPEGLTVHLRNVNDRRRAEEERDHLVDQLLASLERARAVEEFTNALSQALTLGEVASITVDRCRRSLGTVFAGPALITADGRHIQFVTLDPLPEQTVQDWSLTPMSLAMPLTDAASLNCALYHGSRDELSAEYPDMVSAVEVAGTHALATLPLVASGRVIGTMSMAWDRPRTFTDDDKAFIVTLTNQCALAVERARLFETQRGAADILARAILPDHLPTPAGWQLEARYIPATENIQVGGDFYDAYEIDGSVVLTVGDVAGHGIRAAAVMGQVRNALRGFALDHLDPDDVMTRVRKLIRLFDPEEMITMLFGVIEPATGSLTWASAGHPPPLILAHGGRATYLEDAPCGPIGAPPPRVYPSATHRTRLEPGDTMYWYTDGLIEQRGEHLDEGFERLRVAVETAASVGDGLDAVIEQLRPTNGWQDDVCVLAVRWDRP